MTSAAWATPAAWWLDLDVVDATSATFRWNQGEIDNPAVLPKVVIDREAWINAGRPNVLTVCTGDIPTTQLFPELSTDDLPPIGP